MKNIEPSFTKVNDAIDVYKNSQNEKTLSDLFKVSEGKRRELFMRNEYGSKWNINHCIIERRFVKNFKRTIET